MIRLKDVTISVSRPQGGSLDESGEDYVRVEVMDHTSRTRVMQLDLKLIDFALLITGRSEVPVTRALYHGTDAVGKKRISEKRRTFISKTEISEIGGSWPRANLENWLLETKQEEGWHVEPYLGSQSSIEFDQAGAGEWLNYRVFKYVPDTE